MDPLLTTATLETMPHATTPAMDIIAPPKPQTVNAAVVEAPAETAVDQAPTALEPIISAQPPSLPNAGALKRQKTAPSFSMATVVVTLASIFFIGLSALAYYAYSSHK